MDGHCAASSNYREPKAKSRQFTSDVGAVHEMEVNEEPIHVCEGDDDDNQDDSELLLADDDDGDFNELAAETSSLGSSDSSGFVCSEDQRTFTAVRVRPMLPSEKKNGYRSIVDMAVTCDGLMTRVVNPTALPPPSRNHGTARYSSTKLPLVESTSATDTTNFLIQFTQEFRIDYTYWSFDSSPGHQVATQSTIYDELGVLALQTIFQGNNCSIFAYGQPSAGKTYSMMGSSGERASLPAAVRANGNVSGARVPTLSVSGRRGLIPRICQGLFAEIDEGKSLGSSYTVIMSYVEIYDERVYDLLSLTTMKKSLKVREHPEDGAFVERAKRAHVTSYSQILELIEEGNRSRSVASSSSTWRPTRSHTVLFISLSQNSPADLGPRKSKLCMVDLAGSERADRSDVNGLSVREAASVNRSLATLADVVGALAKRKSSRSTDSSQHQKVFAPYRNSVLTRLLKDCLGGHAKTIMLGAISPCCAHYEESIATLRYLERTKSAYSTARIPTELSGELTQKLLDDANELKSNLSALNTCNPVSPICCKVPEHHEECLNCGVDDQSPRRQQIPGQPTETVEEKAVASCEQESHADVEKPVDHAQGKNISEFMLKRSVHLLNLVVIRRHLQTVDQYRAWNRWRARMRLYTTEGLRVKQDDREPCELACQNCTNFSPQKTSERKAGCPPLHNRTPTAERRGVDRAHDVVAAVVTADALCCSVVQDFLFPDCPDSPKLKRPSTVSSTSLLELLASSSEFDRSEFRFDNSGDCSENELQLEDLASPESRSDGDELELNLPLDLDIIYMKGDEGSASPLLSLEPCSAASSLHSTLSLCVDSIDMARRALGPGVHNLRDDSGTGVERELLTYLDKKFIAMTRSVEDVMLSLRSCTPSQPCYALLESMIGEFCLQIISKLCDQLPSAISACVAGRLQLETQLEHFTDRLRQFLQEVVRWGDSRESNHADIALVMATELLVMTERIKLVWSFVGYRKRERLLQMHTLEATAFKDRKIVAKIAALEERNAELSAKCDSLLTTSARQKEPNRIPNHAIITLEQFGEECDVSTKLKRDDNLGAKLAVEVARTRDVQARNDELLCRFATLNRALAAASARVTALEAENTRLNNELVSTISSVNENTSGKNAAAMNELNCRIAVLNKELEYANSNAHKMERQLACLKHVNIELVSELESVQALLTREKEERKKVELVEAQSKALVADLNYQLADAVVRSKELAVAKSGEDEERWRETNVALVEVQTSNAELSVSLVELKRELRSALERATHFESESGFHMKIIEELRMKLEIQKETTEMSAEDAIAVRLVLTDYISAQASKISQLETCISLINQSRQELKAKLAAAEQDRNEHILLLTQTEEALANALDREAILRSELDDSSARDLGEINRVRAELHESTLEVTSLREELTELLDHSTLQSATIENLKLEQAEILGKCQELMLERDEQVLHCQAMENVATQKEAVDTERSTELVSSLERQLEIERQECMAAHETLQRQGYIFNKLQTQQHSIKMNYCSTIRDLKAQINALSIKTRTLSEEVRKTKEVQRLQEARAQEQEQLASASKEQLQQCQVDLNACSHRWMRAETQCVLLRISIAHLNRYLIEAREVCNMQLADVESSQLANYHHHQATLETAQAVKDELISLDTWFDEVVSNNQTMTEKQPATDISAHDKERDKARDEDAAERSSLLKTLTDLSALTSELLGVYEASPEGETQSAELKPLTKHAVRPDGEDIGTGNSEGSSEILQGITTQKTNASSEVAQLRKLVMKLKEASDAKDDMLLFLDGKVRSLEQLVSE